MHLLQLWKLILDCIDCCILFLKEQLTSSSVTGGRKMVEREADKLYLYLCLYMWHKHMCICVFVDLREKLKSRLEGFEAQPRIILGSGKMIGEHQLLPSANANMCLCVLFSWCVFMCVVQLIWFYVCRQMTWEDHLSPRRGREEGDTHLLLVSFSLFGKYLYNLERFVAQCPCNQIHSPTLK